MSGDDEKALAILQMRDELARILKELDRLQLTDAGISVNIAIEVLNKKLGIETDMADIARLRAKLFLGDTG